MKIYDYSITKGKDMDAKKGSDYKAQILRIIADNELSVFGTEDIITLMGKAYSQLKYALGSLLADNQIYRIQAGLYCVRNYQNPCRIANVMFKNSAKAYSIR